MTYARSRLWLGIGGVGLLVLVTLATLLSGAPHWIFTTSKKWSPSDFSSLTSFVVVFAAIMLPLDLIGGLTLPRAFNRQDIARVLSSSLNFRKSTNTLGHTRVLQHQLGYATYLE